jgi:hypothetical protein
MSAPIIDFNSMRGPPPDPENGSPLAVQGKGAKSKQVDTGNVDKQVGSSAGQETQALASCEFCGRTFPRRDGSGGRPQLFCSRGCKDNFHNGKVPSVNKVPAVIVSGSGKPPATAAIHPDHVFFRRRRAVAAYFNEDEDLVIRQEADGPIVEQVIIIDRDDAFAFIDKLCDIYGIGRAAP